MKTHRLFAVILCVVLCSQIVRAQDMDAAITKLTEDVATKIKEHGNKKVTAMDFTDLEGGSSELGRYVAEQMTVDFVMSKRDFSVLDRANRNKILAELKLSDTGLVNPENAKKLGSLSGVDALILGTITPVGKNINVTVKVITTDSSEVAGGAKTKFEANETVQQLLSKVAKPHDSSNPSPPESPAIAKQFGNLRVVVDKLRQLRDGYYSVSLTLQNKSTSNPIAVALYSDKYDRLRTSLVAADGTQLECSSDLVGVKSIFRNPQRLTSIDPSGEQKATIQFFSRDVSRSVTSFTFQSEVVINQNYNVHDYDNYRAPVARFGSGDNSQDDSLPKNCKVENLVLEIPTPK